MAVRINGKDFEDKVIKAAKPVLVEFYSDSCIACKMLSPVLGKIEDEYRGQLDIYKVNAVFDPELAAEYQVLGAPTLLLFHNGEIQKRAQGALKKEELAEWIGEVLQSKI